LFFNGEHLLGVQPSLLFCFEISSSFCIPGDMRKCLLLIWLMWVLVLLLSLLLFRFSAAHENRRITWSNANFYCCCNQWSIWTTEHRWIEQHQQHHPKYGRIGIRANAGRYRGWRKLLQAHKWSWGCDQ
jgi:hypothetical protein